MMKKSLILALFLLQTLICIKGFSQTYDEKPIIFIDTIKVDDPYLMVFENQEISKSTRQILLSGKSIESIIKKELTYDSVIISGGYEYDSPCMLNPIILKRRLLDWNPFVDTLINRSAVFCENINDTNFKLLTAAGEYKKYKNFHISKVNCDLFALFLVRSEYLYSHWNSSHTIRGIKNMPNIYLPLVIPIVRR